MPRSGTSLIDPAQGLVVTFNYLWAADGAKGNMEARKPRPCIIAAVADAPNPRLGQIKIVGVLALTHTAPKSGVLALPVPDGDRRVMGLDAEPCWVICGEMNSSIWPGYDLLRTPAARDGWTRGKVPPAFLDQILSTIRNAVETMVFRNVPRS